MFTKGKECGDPCKNMCALDGVPPPCESCYPVPLQNNIAAVQVYNLCANQLIVSGMGEIIGMNYLAIFEVMNLLEIQNRLDCLNRVNVLFAHIQEMRDAQ